EAQLVAPIFRWGRYGRSLHINRSLQERILKSRQSPAALLLLPHRTNTLGGPGRATPERRALSPTRRGRYREDKGSRKHLFGSPPRGWISAAATPNGLSSAEPHESIDLRLNLGSVPS